MARRLEAASQYSVIASNWEGRCLARDVHHWAYSAAPFSVATPVRVLNPINHAEYPSRVPRVLAVVNQGAVKDPDRLALLLVAPNRQRVHLHGRREGAPLQDLPQSDRRVLLRFGVLEVHARQHLLCAEEKVGGEVTGFAGDRHLVVPLDQRPPLGERLRWPVAGKGRHHRARGRCRGDRHGRGRRDFDVGSPLLPRLGPHVVHDRLDDRMLRLGRLVVSAGDLDPLQELRQGRRNEG